MVLHGQQRSAHQRRSNASFIKLHNKFFFGYKIYIRSLNFPPWSQMKKTKKYHARELGHILQKTYPKFLGIVPMSVKCTYILISSIVDCILISIIVDCVLIFPIIDCILRFPIVDCILIFPIVDCVYNIQNCLLYSYIQNY